MNRLRLGFAWGLDRVGDAFSVLYHVLFTPILILLSRGATTAHWLRERWRWYRSLSASQTLAKCWRAVKRSPDYRQGYFSADGQILEADTFYKMAAYKHPWFGDVRAELDAGAPVCQITLRYLGKRSLMWLVLVFYVSVRTNRVLGLEQKAEGCCGRYEF